MANIAEILKNAPKELELYSPVYGKINLRKYTHNIFPIVCADIEDTDRFFTSSGKFRDDFVYLRDCSLCPAKSFCDKDDDDGVLCEEKFYQWALMED